MPSLTAIAEPTFGRVRLELDFSDTPAATYLHVHRGLAAAPAHGVEPVVRLHGVTADQTDAFGTWTMKRASNGRAVFYDTELPLDTPVYYRADSSQLLSVAGANAGPVTIASDDAIWIKDPIHPANDLRATVVRDPIDPACNVNGGVYVVGFGDASYGSRSGRFTVEDSPYPIAATRLRGEATSSLVLVTKQLADRTAMKRLLATGGVLFVQTPATWGYGDMYIDVADVNENRLDRDHRVPWRQWQLPYAVVEQPPGLQFGVDGARWRDLCDVYATWGAITAAGKTWTDVFQREVG